MAIKGRTALLAVVFALLVIQILSQTPSLTKQQVKIEIQTQAATQSAEPSEPSEPSEQPEGFFQQLSDTETNSMYQQQIIEEPGNQFNPPRKTRIRVDFARAKPPTKSILEEKVACKTNDFIFCRVDFCTWVQMQMNSLDNFEKFFQFDIFTNEVIFASDIKPAKRSIKLIGVNIQCIEDLKIKISDNNGTVYFEKGFGVNISIDDPNFPIIAKFDVFG